MTIRQASLDDADTLSNLVLEVAATIRASDFSDDGWALLEQTNTTEAFVTRIESESYKAFVYEVDKVIAGYIAMLDFEKVDHMFVLPQYQGLGLSRKLWSHAQCVCKKNGKGDYYWVRSSTYAEPIYQRFGFHLVGERDTSSGISSQRMEKGVA